MSSYSSLGADAWRCPLVSYGFSGEVDQASRAADMPPGPHVMPLRRCGAVRRNGGDGRGARGRPPSALGAVRPGCGTAMRSHFSPWPLLVWP